MAIETLIAPSASAVDWDPEVDDELLCINIRQETHDVKSFTFVSPHDKRFNFRAGQYFLFEPSLGGEKEGRCYSVSSSPTRKNAVTFTVKRVPDGRVSTWMHDGLRPGDKIKASGPFGTFVRPSVGEKLLLASGGSGITPVISILWEIVDRALPTDVVFMHACRTPQDIVFRSELTYLASRLKGLRLHLLPEEIGTETSWPGITGRISSSYLALAVPDIAERTVMCCGPAPFMAALRRLASDLGVPSQNYFEESFASPVEDDAPPPVAVAEGSKAFEVAFAKQGRSILIPTDQSILACAKKAGLRIPSSCANGICGTCKSKLLSGVVDMQHSGGIRQREIDAGLFLPCCSKPLSDLVIDR
jgi:ferredoxin-NADP reductase